MYNKMNHIYIYICSSLLSLPPSLPLLWVITEYQGEFPVQYSSFPTGYLFHAQPCIYVNATLLAHPTLSFTLCPQVSSPCLYLYSCPANRFICTIFLDSIYTIFIQFLQYNIDTIQYLYNLIYNIYFSLSDFTLYDRL